MSEYICKFYQFYIVIYNFFAVFDYGHKFFLAESVAQVDRLAAMVNDVLRSGSVAEQALRQEKRLRIDKLVTEVVDDYMLLAKTRSMTFTVNTEPTTIRANRDMMRHVISNLVSNAVRHGDAGSVIKITCDQQQLAIENACKPLTKQQLQHVFDPFYRIPGVTKQHTDSSDREAERYYECRHHGEGEA